jgi:protein TonB
VAAQSVEASIDIAWKQQHMPDYPRDELNNGESCSLVLLVDINESGEPTGVTTEKGCHNSHFERSAKDAAMKWRFTPKMENGRRVPGRARVPVDFTNPNQ